MSAILWTFLSVGAISLLSLSGAIGLSFGLLQKHRVMMALVALAAGTLLGDAFIHLLPEAATAGFTPAIGLWVLGGFLVMFVIEVVLRRGHSHAEHMDDDHGHDHGHEKIQPFGWLNLVGDGLHNFLDGVIIAAAFIISPAAGIATTVAVAIHEIPQELGDFAVLVRSGMPVRKALLLNFGSALLAMLGAAMIFTFQFEAGALEAVALPLIAGAFVYIAAADLVPELHHHNKGKDMVVIVTALVLGLAIMVALLGLEPLFEG